MDIEHKYPVEVCKQLGAVQPENHQLEQEMRRLLSDMNSSCYIPSILEKKFYKELFSVDYSI